MIQNNFEECLTGHLGFVKEVHLDEIPKTCLSSQKQLFKCSGSQHRILHIQINLGSKF